LFVEEVKKNLQDIRKNDGHYNNKQTELQSNTKTSGGGWESAKDVEDKNKEKRKSTSWDDVKKDKNDKNERSNSWDNNDNNDKILKLGPEKPEKKGSVVNVKNMTDDRDYDDRRGRDDDGRDEERSRGMGVGRDDNANQRGAKRSSSPSKGNRFLFFYLYTA
jgi:hypothetical protein